MLAPINQIGKCAPNFSVNRRVLDKINKNELSEIDICDLFITPAIKDAGWDPMRQIRREVTLTPGPVIHDLKVRIAWSNPDSAIEMNNQNNVHSI